MKKNILVLILIAAGVGCSSSQKQSGARQPSSAGINLQGMRFVPANIRFESEAADGFDANKISVVVETGREVMVPSIKLIDSSVGHGRNQIAPLTIAENVSTVIQDKRLDKFDYTNGILKFVDQIPHAQIAHDVSDGKGKIFSHIDVRFYYDKKQMFLDKNSTLMDNKVFAPGEIRSMLSGFNGRYRGQSVQTPLEFICKVIKSNQDESYADFKIKECVWNN